MSRQFIFGSCSYFFKYLINFFLSFLPLHRHRQDALSSATDKINSEREIDGQRYYSIQIDSPDVQYLATFTVNMGKVFALFVKCPTRSFKASEEALRHVQDTFHTL